jgi:hypothetical protein
MTEQSKLCHWALDLNFVLGSSAHNKLGWVSNNV